jgi:DNA mismatch repair ATPase MutS
MRYQKPEGESRLDPAFTEDNVFIDTDTVRNLELVTNQLSNKATNTLYGEREPKNS